MYKVIEIFKAGLDENRDSASWRWKLSSSFEYSVKTGYALAYGCNMSRNTSLGEASNWEWRAKCGLNSGELGCLTESRLCDGNYFITGYQWLAI